MVFDNPPPLKAPDHAGSEEAFRSEPPESKLELASANGQPETAGSTTMPMEYGSIDRITADGQWKKFESTSEQALNVKGESYTHEGVTDRSGIYHEYWLGGGGGSAETRAAVLHVLSKPDHHLTRSEIKGIRLALSTDEALADRFDIKDAWTKHINGKQVIFTEGVSIADPDRGAYLFSAYPVSPKFPGTLPERLSYVADIKGDYENFAKTDYHRELVGAMESMRFKPEGTYDDQLPRIGISTKN